jgi:hypothetical protein
MSRPAHASCAQHRASAASAPRASSARVRIRARVPRSWTSPPTSAVGSSPAICPRRDRLDLSLFCASRQSNARPAASPTARISATTACPVSSPSSRVSLVCSARGTAASTPCAHQRAVCSACVPGFYEPRSLSTGCLRCGLGQFQIRQGKSFCSNCTAGRSAPLLPELSRAVFDDAPRCQVLRPAVVERVQDLPAGLLLPAG